MANTDRGVWAIRARHYGRRLLQLVGLCFIAWAIWTALPVVELVGNLQNMGTTEEAKVVGNQQLVPQFAAFAVGIAIIWLSY